MDQTVEEFIAVMERAPSLNSFEYVWSALNRIAELAGNVQNHELQNTIQDIMPLLKQIAHAYQKIGNAVSVLDEINEKMKLHQSMVQSFLPDSIVEIAANTTANVGDYVLVKSTKKLIDTVNLNMNWCIVNVRESVDEQFIKMCNRTRALVIGGGGLFLRDTNENYISGSGSVRKNY